jgi:hypothetical protein
VISSTPGGISFDRNFHSSNPVLRIRVAVWMLWLNETGARRDSLAYVTTFSEHRGDVQELPMSSSWGLRT